MPQGLILKQDTGGHLFMSVMLLITSELRDK